MCRGLGKSRLPAAPVGNALRGLLGSVSFEGQDGGPPFGLYGWRWNAYPAAKDLEDRVCRPPFARGSQWCMMLFDAAPMQSQCEYYRDDDGLGSRANRSLQGCRSGARLPHTRFSPQSLAPMSASAVNHIHCLDTTRRLSVANSRECNCSVSQ